MVPPSIAVGTGNVWIVLWHVSQVVALVLTSLGRKCCISTPFGWVVVCDCPMLIFFGNDAD
jgi:hypothetical protein